MHKSEIQYSKYLHMHTNRLLSRLPIGFRHWDADVWRTLDSVTKSQFFLRRATRSRRGCIPYICPSMWTLVRPDARSPFNQKFFASQNKYAIGSRYFMLMLLARRATRSNKGRNVLVMVVNIASVYFLWDQLQSGIDLPCPPVAPWLTHRANATRMRMRCSCSVWFDHQVAAAWPWSNILGL